MRMMFTSGTESRPKGALLSSRSLMWQYVSCVDRRADERRRHRAAHDAALPLRAARLLPRRRRLPRRDQHHPAGARPGRDPAGDRGAPGHEVLRAADDLDRRCCATPTSTPPTCRRCARATTAPRRCRSPCWRRCAAGCPTSTSGTSTARPRWPRSPRSSDPRSSSPTPARPAGRRSTSRPGSSTTRTSRSRPGTVGEIVHRSPHATLGYYLDPEKTTEAFRGGWFHSGDLGYLDDGGRLYVVDRKKDMIKTGGENVASREVEEAIYQLDGVAEVAVFGVDHPRWVEAVAAVVVPKDGATLTPEAVLEHTAVAAGRLQDTQVRRRRRRAPEEPVRQDPQARAPRGARRPGRRRRLRPAQKSIERRRRDQRSTARTKSRRAASDLQTSCSAVACRRDVMASTLEIARAARSSPSWGISHQPAREQGAVRLQQRVQRERYVDGGPCTIRGCPPPTSSGTVVVQSSSTTPAASRSPRSDGPPSHRMFGPPTLDQGLPERERRRRATQLAPSPGRAPQPSPAARRAG